MLIDLLHILKTITDDCSIQWFYQSTENVISYSKILYMSFKKNLFI